MFEISKKLFQMYNLT